MSLAFEQPYNVGGTDVVSFQLILYLAFELAVTELFLSPTPKHHSEREVWPLPTLHSVATARVWLEGRGDALVFRDTATEHIPWV